MDSVSVNQSPGTGGRVIKITGDTITFTLNLNEPLPGRAWLRTNLGQAHRIRKEIIRAITHDEPILGHGWYDIPMIPVSPFSFKLTLGIYETGHFEAKCFFLPIHEKTPVWPPGDNVSINVQPADTCCANIIYNAFVRQFGPNKNGAFRAEKENLNSVKLLDDAGYTVIPPSGTFRDLMAELDFIIGYLGCRIIHLLPINPTPTTYGRMGRFGSPYAALDFTGIDPALAVFDPRATPLEQFIELVDAVHARNAKIIIDIAPNHTGWAADLHETHPEWLVRDKEGKIEAPGAWGVVWEDLTRLDYTHKELWQYMADVFMTWCRRGVDGFRCDAGYMIPLPAWTYIIASVREEFPDALFFLEGLGGKISVTRDLLGKANFNWAYSELFQNYDRGQIDHYLPEALDISCQDGVMVNFAETHDNNRLAAASLSYASMRVALCALSSSYGAFGFANGVEWYATEKIDVHDARSLNWGATTNQTQWIKKIHHLLRTHPAFFDQTDIRLIQKGQGNNIVILRCHRPSGKKLLILVNLDADHPTTVWWDPRDTHMDVTRYRDLLSGETVDVDIHGELQAVNLPPGRVCCLTSDPADFEMTRANESNAMQMLSRIRHQCLRALALEIRRIYADNADLEDFDPDAAACDLAKNPIDFCTKMNPFSDESRVTLWRWPSDIARHVMIPPDHFLMVRADVPFRASLINEIGGSTKTFGITDSLRAQDGSYFALFPPHGDMFRQHTPAKLKISVFNGAAATHSNAPLLFLTHGNNVSARKIFNRREALNTPLRFLGTNGRGAMMRAHAAWGKIESKYDALLAANLHPRYPVDRTMMLIRCRAWLVYQGYSSDISIDCLDHVAFDNGQYFWRFTAPCGQGQHVALNIMAEMAQGFNQIRLTFTGGASRTGWNQLPAKKQVALILRPDIDDRSFHENTKAYQGPEHLFPSSCQARPDGFSFAPSPDHRLDVHVSSGEFFPEPEWQYMVHLPAEAERGLDPHTDLFSPGYFKIFLEGGASVQMSASAQIIAQAPVESSEASPPRPSPFPLKLPAVQAPLEAMKSALHQFIVRRDNLKTIIAGYPWFLDWGRDTLIATRGLIAAGHIEASLSILKQFAEFEHNGTLPNIIHGENAANRDTSDAPLWFFVACGDLIRITGKTDFLKQSCGSRTIREVLVSIAKSYINGTPNGIYVDPSTQMVFSPPHFTWMDTNFPAATPRQGYPIEIQALWHYALRFLSRVDKMNKKMKWANRADQVRESITQLFHMPDEGYLADCLCAPSGISAAHAEIDNALRPNQLFAVTLEAVHLPDIIRGVIRSCESLVVPGGIRSLADKPVKRPLPVIHNGRLCNDPLHPYKGVYAGDEDTQRKPAYHNGTAWTWIFPSFCEAWAKAFGKAGKQTALAMLSSSALLMNSGCAGQLPEILDGDFPHTQRGCDAQAWSVSEWVRVWDMLTNENI
jgi:predicted glycogen debranching enzyme